MLYGLLLLLIDAFMYVSLCALLCWLYVCVALVSYCAMLHGRCLCLLCLSVCVRLRVCMCMYVYGLCVVDCILLLCSRWLKLYVCFVCALSCYFVWFGMIPFCCVCVCLCVVVGR